MDKEIEELLIKHFVESLRINNRLMNLVVYGPRYLPQEFGPGPLPPNEEEHWKRVEEKIQEEVQLRDPERIEFLQQWRNKLIFGHLLEKKLSAQEREILAQATPEWIKAKIKDQLQFQEAQKKELDAAERGDEELPKILGSSYQKRVAKGELKKFSETDEWYKNEWLEQVFWWHRKE